MLKVGGYSEYQINSAIDTLKKLKLKGDVDSIVKQMERYKQSKISDEVAMYSGEAYVILTGRIIDGKFSNKNKDINFEIVSPSVTDLQSELTAYLMKVNSYEKNRNGLNAKCEVVAQWEFD